MKIYGKYLIIAYNEELDEKRIAAAFPTRKEAIERLDTIFTKNGKRLGENLWREIYTGLYFYVEKNAKEYNV